MEEFDAHGGALWRPRFFSAKRRASICAAAAAMLALAGVAAAGAGASGAFPHAVSSAGARLAPPATLRCDRNQLTSFNGEVTSYERTAEQTRIEITTDWGSVESFTLPHADGRVEQRFLLWGEPFQAADWSQVETAPGQLIDGMQAIIWVCEHPAVTPVVDWRPRRRDVSEQ